MIDEKMIKIIERECKQIDNCIVTFRSKRYNVYEFKKVGDVTLSFLFRSNRNLIIDGERSEFNRKYPRISGNEFKRYYAPVVLDTKDYDYEYEESV